MSPTGNMSAAVGAALGSESTTSGIQKLLEFLVQTTGSDAGRILLLDLGSGTYEQRASVGHGDDEITQIAAFGNDDLINGPPIDVLEVAARSRRRASWSHRGRTAPSVYHKFKAQHRVVLPVMRGSTAIALIDLESRADRSYSTVDENLPLISTVINQLYERRRVLRLLYELKRPVYVEQTRRDFYDDVADLIARATGMQFIAVREIEGERLACSAAHGLDVQRGELDELDLSPVDDFPTFARALRGNTTHEPTSGASHLGNLMRNPKLRRVKSFVVAPIFAGEATIGVLSVASSCPYEYSRLELQGIETVANATGVAIANFKNRHTAADDVRRLATLSANTLGDLLAQSARHESKRILDNAQKRLNLTRRALRGKPTQIVDPISGLQEISDNIKQAVDALDKMKTNALVDPSQKPTRCDLRRLTEAAQNQIRGQLESLEISVTVPREPIWVQVIYEPAALAFLHLLENSIRAFESSKAKKRGRRIEISAGALQSGEERRRITYSDNATGIDPRSLKIPPEIQHVPWQQAIFERGVSGTGGSGYGLYLVRTLLEQASAGGRGSIGLLEHSGGRIAFEVLLPIAD